MQCHNCVVFKVPAYHLAMSDSSIRNFCSLPCVLGFQVTGGANASVFVFVLLFF